MLFDAYGRPIHHVPSMPVTVNQLQVVNGKPRIWWMDMIAKAIISSTDVGMRFKMVHDGKVAEIMRLMRDATMTDPKTGSRVKVQDLIGFRLTADECRWIFWRLTVSMPPAQQNGVPPYWVNRFSLSEIDKRPYWEQNEIDANPIEVETLPEHQKQRIVVN